ncbi:MAG: hypothetical protein ACUVXD_09265 [Thermodesulfobacteriota bacterium]
MRNPFSDFRVVPYQKKELPLERIVRAKEDVMEKIVTGYLRLVEDEVKDLVWLVEHSRVVKAYSAAVKSIRDLQYDTDDIEEFCAELDSSNRIPYMISGPAGIYISALVNHAQEDRIVIRLRDYQRTFHFLGYRLPEGKVLILQGDVGDFIGAGLSGGRLVVEGSAGSWCGAGMMKGEILVTEHAGQSTGEWMRGGEIHVDGRIRSVGNTLFGGKIYQRGKLLAPQDLSGEV